MNVFQPILDAAEEAIRDDELVAAAFGSQDVRIYQIVKETGSRERARYPYIYFPMIEKQAGVVKSCGAAHDVVELTLHVWDMGRGVGRVSAIAEACERPLGLLVVQGVTVHERTHVLTRCQYDEEAKLSLGVVQMRFRVGPVV
jgi:hypothetical protein